MPHNCESCAAIFKALGDENRLHIVRLLRAADEGVCACDLLQKLDITQPTLAHHMKILCAAGLITSRKMGKRTQYSLNPESFLHVSECLALAASGKL